MLDVTPLEMMMLSCHAMLPRLRADAADAEAPRQMPAAADFARPDADYY